MAYVIKRYSNRKLYDTQESRYVTLEEIEEMIRAGREISVVDAASGEDLTSVTLTQIILENERNHRATLPTGFLHQLIKHGEAWQEFVQRTMRSSLEGFVSSQRDMERVFREWSSRSGWGPVTGATSSGTSFSVTLAVTTGASPPPRPPRPPRPPPPAPPGPAADVLLPQAEAAAPATTERAIISAGLKDIAST